MLGKISKYNLYYSLIHLSSEILLTLKLVQFLKWKSFNFEICTDSYYIMLIFYQINKDGEIRTRD